MNSPPACSKFGSFLSSYNWFLQVFLMTLDLRDAKTTYKVMGKVYKIPGKLLTLLYKFLVYGHS